MKKLMVIILCMGFIYGTNAQIGHKVTGVYHGSVGHVFYPRFGVGFGYYSPFYSSYGYFGFPYGLAYGGYYPSYSRSSTLQRKEDDIRADYADRIYSVRRDSSLNSKQKHETIHGLKKDRKKEIHDLVANYHKQPVTK